MRLVRLSLNLGATSRNDVQLIVRLNASKKSYLFNLQYVCNYGSYGRKIENTDVTLCLLDSRHCFLFQIQFFLDKRPTRCMLLSKNPTVLFELGGVIG